MSTIVIHFPSSRPLTPQRARTTLSDLPDEILSMIYAHNVMIIDDLDEYLASARINRATYRCATEVLFRFFRSDREDELYRLYHKITNVEIWARSTGPGRNLVVPAAVTRDRAAFPDYEHSRLRNGYALVTGIQWCLSSPTREPPDDELVYGSMAVSFDLRADTSADVQHVLERMRDAVRVMPELRTITIRVEVLRLDWLKLNSVPLKELDDAVLALESEGYTARVQKPETPNLLIAMWILLDHIFRIPDVDDRSSWEYQSKMHVLTTVAILLMGLLLGILASYPMSPGTTD